MTSLFFKRMGSKKGVQKHTPFQLSQLENYKDTIPRKSPPANLNPLPEGLLGVQGEPPPGAPRGGAPGGPPEAFGHKALLITTLRRYDVTTLFQPVQNPAGEDDPGGGVVG